MTELNCIICSFSFFDLIIWYKFIPTWVIQAAGNRTNRMVTYKKLQSHFALSPIPKIYGSDSVTTRSATINTANGQANLLSFSLLYCFDISINFQHRTLSFIFLRCLQHYMFGKDSVSMNLPKISLILRVLRNIIVPRILLYCISIIRGKIMLGGFEGYLTSKAALNEKYIPYYLKWVSYCYSFLDQPDNSLLTSEQVQSYLNHISKTR